MASNPEFAQHGEPTYVGIRKEALPPLHELEAEHRQMKAEMAAAGEGQKRNFEKMMSAWARRARSEGAI